MANCLSCGRPLVEMPADLNDPALNCGGDCQECVREAEAAEDAWEAEREDAAAQIAAEADLERYLLTGH